MTRIAFWSLAFFAAARLAAQGGAMARPALDAGRLEAVVQRIEEEIASGRVGAAALLVARHGAILVEKGFGRLSPEPGSPACQPDSIFLIASITKPVTVTAVMKLVEQGRVRLDDPVGKFIPEFRGGDRDRVTVRHLLTHTSGLPDMVPNNMALRQRQAPLGDFVAEAAKTPLLFRPGAKVSYQSMGILLASEIVERVSGRSLDAFLRTAVFAPLGMDRTSMGIGNRPIAATVQCLLPAGGDAAGTNSDSNWNSPYWRKLGVPWGGLHSTVGDVHRLLQAMMDGGGGILEPGLARAMISNQTPGLNQSWGFGWRIEEGLFLDRPVPGTFGHSGATGTLCWADPQRKLVFVFFTNRASREDDGKFLRIVAGMVSEAAGP